MQMQYNPVASCYPKRSCGSEVRKGCSRRIVRMLLIGITDIHGDVRALDRMNVELAAADLVVACGDLTTFGDKQEAKRVVDEIRRRCKRLLAVPGNCDTKECILHLEEAGCSLHEKIQIVDGIAFVGLGGSLPCIGPTPTEFTETQIAEMLDLAAENLSADMPFVLVAHEPPLNTLLDNANNGGHVGSASVRSFIETRNPILCLCGHIHESRATDRINETKIANPGPLRDGNYAYADISQSLKTLEIRTC